MDWKGLREKMEFQQGYCLYSNIAHCYILMCNIVMLHIKIRKEASKAKNSPFTFIVLISQDMVL